MERSRLRLLTALVIAGAVALLVVLFWTLNTWKVWDLIDQP
jgi:hypothetical protein